MRWVLAERVLPLLCLAEPDAPRPDCSSAAKSILDFPAAVWSQLPGRRRWNMYRMKTAKHVKLHGIRSPPSL